MKSLREIDLKGKRVLVRADFNVFLDEHEKIIDDFRIKQTLPTIEYLIKQGARTILIAHLGRPQPSDAREKFSLRPVGQRLTDLLGKEVKFIEDCLGGKVAKEANGLSNGEILLLENLRFYPAEEQGDENFAKQLASLAEVYVNDAFGVCHRAHASVVAIAKFLPGYAGFLLEKEVENLTRLRDKPDYPLCVVIGGVKISTKIKLIQNFLNKADDIILGGALANTVLHAKGLAVGKSIIEETMATEIQKLEITTTKLHLPVDAIWCADKNRVETCHSGPVGFTQKDDSILDIGPDTEKLYGRIIKAAKMIIWNGPMGLFEIESFARGTKAVAEAIIGSSAYSIAGGGETVAYLSELGLTEKFSFISTGGGAMMEFLAGEKLPGIEALE